MIDLEWVVLAALILLLGLSFGPRFDPWGPIRRAFLPPLDRALSQIGGYAETRAPESEYVATVDADLDELQRALFRGGWRQYPLASLATTDDGRSETASWARHRRLWSTRQDHTRIYDSRDDRIESGQYDLYAHWELTAHLPWTAWRHYRGIGLDREEGVRRAREWLETTDLEYEIAHS